MVIQKSPEIAVPLKHLSNLWRTLEMPLINCEVSLDLAWPENRVIYSGTEKVKFGIADTRLYDPVVTLSTEENIKLLNQLESGFKRTINWKKYQSKDENKDQNRHFNYLIDPSFQGISRLFVLSFENNTDRKLHTKYYIPKVEMKDYNVPINGRNFFDQLIKNDLKTYDNIKKMMEMVTQLRVY